MKCFIFGGFSFFKKYFLAPLHMEGTLAAQLLHVGSNSGRLGWQLWVSAPIHTLKTPFSIKRWKIYPFHPFHSLSLSSSPNLLSSLQTLPGSCWRFLRLQQSLELLPSLSFHLLVGRCHLPFIFLFFGLFGAFMCCLWCFSCHRQ